MIIVGDCREVMAGMDAASADAIVTDPPYGLSFMGKDWDHGVPGVPFWTETLRVLKPGSHLLAFGGTRTFHRMTAAIEDAGFEIRDCLSWLYGSGFPKSLDVSKAIDKMAGAEREVVGKRKSGIASTHSTFGDDNWKGIGQETFDITTPATPDAERWQGWGTALKPAWEPIIVARKPLVGTVAANVLAHGTGALNIDACRIGRDADDVSGWSQSGSKASENRAMSGPNYSRDPKPDNPQGRWPANVILDETSAALLDEMSGERRSGVPGTKRRPFGGLTTGRFGGHETERTGYNDTGGASRYFFAAPIDDPDADLTRFAYHPKASRRERNAGLDGMPERLAGSLNMRTDAHSHANGMNTAPAANHHPTVKPIALMRWLVRLVTPPGGLVLDPFAGSGSTGCAAVMEGFDFIGIEQDESYAEIAERRIAYWTPRVLQPALPLEGAAD